MLAATHNLAEIPTDGRSPIGIEARNAIEMLKTTVAQQANYSIANTGFILLLIKVAVEVGMASLLRFQAARGAIGHNNRSRTSQQFLMPRL